MQQRHLPVRAGVPRRGCRAHGSAGRTKGCNAAASVSKICVSPAGRRRLLERRCPRGCEKNGARKDGVCEPVGRGGEACEVRSARGGAQRRLPRGPRRSGDGRRTPSARASRGGGAPAAAPSCANNCSSNGRGAGGVASATPAGAGPTARRPTAPAAAAASACATPARAARARTSAPTASGRCIGRRCSNNGECVVRGGRPGKRAYFKGEDCSLMDTARVRRPRPACRRRAGAKACLATPAGAGRRATRSCATAGATAAVCARTTRAGASPGGRGRSATGRRASSRARSTGCATARGSARASRGGRASTARCPSRRRAW